MKTILLLCLNIVLCYCDSMANVEKAFSEHQIVPDVLTVPPKKIVNVSYGSDNSVNLGNEMTPTQVKEKPALLWEAEKDAYYTVMMVDPDAPSRANHTLREIRHWLVLNIPGSAVEKGDEVAEYRGSGPPKGTGLHRYIFLIYKQPDGMIVHDEPHVPHRSRAHRKQTSAENLAKKYNLGNPEFGNFYQAQYDEYVDIFAAQSTD